MSVIKRFAKSVRFMPRNRKGHFLPPRQGNMPGLNAWLIHQEVRRAPRG